MTPTRYLFTLVAFLMFTSAACADQCSVLGPASVKILDSPDGQETGSAAGGLTVYATVLDDSKDWASITDFQGWQLGVVRLDSLKCTAPIVDKNYPLILDQKQLRKIGFNFGSPRKGEAECFSNGDGIASLAISKEKAAKLKKLGIDFKAFCVATRTDGLKFDPETGKRLITFVASENLPDSPFEFPLEVPTCLGHGKVTLTDIGADLSLSACGIRFNPFTGGAITEADKALLATSGIRISGEAGPEPSEASLASIRGKTPVSPADLTELIAKLK